MRIYGPYKSGTSDRLFVIKVYNDGRKKTTAYARHVMEQHLGRELTKEETVDHIDGDPLNDAIENLQILTLADNIRKSHPKQEMSKHVCPQCGAEFITNARQVRHNNGTQGKAGPFCGRACAGRWSATHAWRNRHDATGSNPVVREDRVGSTPTACTQ